MPVTTPIEFGGRVVMVGCGSIGQAILPLLRRHLALAADGLIVLAADEVGRGVSQEQRAQFFYAHLKPRSFRRILARHLRRGDLLLNLSVDVSSLDLMTYAAERGALYVDTSIEPWPGVFDNPMLDLRQRSNFTTRRRALQLAAELGRNSPTAVVDHGANPGLVSHFVKRALLELDRALRKGASRPASREDWATLARDLGVTLIQISERDTQVSDRPKRPGEFVNTWSIDGFMDEAMQPSEISFGTARVVGYDAPARVPVPGYNCERLELCLNGVEELYLAAKARWVEQTIFLSDGMVAATTGAFDFPSGAVIACEVLFGGGAVQADFTDFRVGRPSLTVGLKVNLVPTMPTTSEISFITAFSHGSFVGGAKPRFGTVSPLWAYRSQPAQIRISTPAGGALTGSGKFVHVRMLIVPNELAGSADAVSNRTLAAENVFWPYEGQAPSGALDVAISAGATVSQTVTATGLAAGDMADASFSAALAPGLLKTVEAVANGIKVSLTNPTAAVIGGPAGTIYVQGRKRQLQ